MTDHEFLRGLVDDHHYTPDIKTHSLEKIRLHNYYARLFSSSMKDKWPQRAYVGLYSGAGRARIEETGEIIETTAMSVFRLRHPFTKYIFVDHDPRCIGALKNRIATLGHQHDVTLLERNVRDGVADIMEAMPPYGRNRGLISFCFIDPFSADLDFEIIRTLGTRYKMDFLVLLMLGRDVRTNFKRYLESPADTRIASLIDDPDWRSEWIDKRLSWPDLIRFLLGKFDAAMTRLGYQAARPDDAHPVRVIGKGVVLYFIVLYSKDPLGRRFWQVTREGTDPQMPLGL